MRPETFEESEFEDALYNQLERGSHLLWSPGQVLEGRIGFDRSLLVDSVRFWRWLGFTKPLRGAALSRYSWPSWWRPIRPDPALPSFRQNLFLQVKRSQYGPQPPRVAKHLGFSGPTWSFRLKPKQQKALDLLAKTTAGRALVAYAGPVFHTRRQLLAHTKARSMVANSTFPSAARLTGHTAWYYQRPGANGIANPEPEVIEETPVEVRLRELVAPRVPENVDLAEELGFLDRALVNSVEAASASVEVVAFFRQRLLLERFAEGLALDPATYHYLLVLHSVEMVGLSWWVAGERGAA